MSTDVLNWQPEPVSNTTFSGKYYEEYFDLEFYQAVSELMQFELTPETLEQFRRGHFEAFEAFHDGEFEWQGYQTDAKERKRLQSVAINAAKLRDSLIELYEFGDACPRLARAIAECSTLFQTHKGDSLECLLTKHGRGFSFYELSNFLTDLEVCAERAQESEPNEKASGQQSNSHKLKTRRCSKDRALQRFLEEFRSVWQELSNHPFTRGRHYAEIAQTSSRLVDVVLLSLSKHQAPYTRQNVVTALRKMQSIEP